MITTIIIVAMMLLIVFLTFIFFVGTDDNTTDISPIFTLLTIIILTAFTYGLYFISMNYLTTWYNNGSIEYTTSTYNPENSTITYGKVEYDVDNLEDKSDNAKNVEYKITIKKQIAKPSLWSPTQFGNKRNIVTVTIVPKT